MLLGVEHDVRGVFSNGYDARREGLRHAANDALIVDWARTLRIDAPPAPELHERVFSLARDGVRVCVSEVGSVPRTYALVEGRDDVDPSELEQRLSGARWYDASIIALAIEPLPADALPLLAEALGGVGAPAGVCECAQIGTRLILEFRPDVTQPALINRIIDVELRRFGGARRTELLTPLSLATAASIAADGLQANEIAPDRILEALLGLEHVE